MTERGEVTVTVTVPVTGMVTMTRTGTVTVAVRSEADDALRRVIAEQVFRTRGTLRCRHRELQRTGPSRCGRSAVTGVNW